jgi:hypothetical protein
MAKKNRAKVAPKEYICPNCFEFNRLVLISKVQEQNLSKKYLKKLLANGETIIREGEIHACSHCGFRTKIE